MTSPAIEALCDLDEEDIERAIERIGHHEIRDILRDFSEWAQDGQREPPGNWDRWVIMAGRGFGKTRAGAEWIAARAAAMPGFRIALVARPFRKRRP